MYITCIKNALKQTNIYIQYITNACIFVLNYTYKLVTKSPNEFTKQKNLNEMYIMTDDQFFL
jgi:hypothetical protein